MDNDTNLNRALLMLDSSPMAAGFFDKGFNCVDCNLSAIEMFKFDTKDEYINNFYRTMPPYQSHDRGSVIYFKELLAKAFENKKVRSEMIFQKADGILLPAEVTFVCVSHEGADVVIGYFHDLTEIKAIMKEAASSAETAHMYLSASPLAMELFNDKARIEDCNQQALDLLGFPNVDEYKKRITYLSPKHLYNETYTRMKDKDLVFQALSEGYIRYEWVYYRENGEKIPCEITRVCITRSDRVYVISYIHDLSMVKAMAEELKKAEAAEKENRAKNQFLAQMSHVLRTPMNAITGLAEIQLQKGGGLNEEDAKEIFMQIQRSSGMLLGIIDDILDLSNAESGNMNIAQKQIDIPSLIMEIVQLSILETERDRVKFILQVDKNLPCVLMGDHLRIKQIANYILSNAFKYTEEGEVILRVAYNGEDFVIVVADTGCGMPEEQAKNLFSSRYNESGNIQGTGLGLTITHRLVQLMNGTINVISEQGEGSVFTVHLPLSAGSDLLLGEEEAARLEDINAIRASLGQKNAIEYEPMPYGRVLVVDDVESNLYVAWGLMKPYELDIDTVNSGAEAIEKIKQGALYDIIFMDHMMPDMDGIQTARALIDMGYKEPIVALTANTIFGQESLFRSNGFEGFLSKPIDVKQLNTYLLRFIRDRYPEEAEKARAASPVKLAPLPETDVSTELTKHFIRDAKNAVAAITEIMQGEIDIKRYTITIHGMKSALANVGVNALSNAAAKLEDAGRDGNTEIIIEETPTFLERLKGTIAKFEQKLETETTAAQGEDDPVFLKEYINAIITACGDYKKSAAKKAINAIKEKPCSKATMDFIDEISAMLLHGEFEQAAELARSYLNTL